MFKFHVNERSPLHRKTLQWAFPGLALHFVAATLDVVRNDLHWVLPLAFGLAGTVLMVVGLRYMALSKERSPWWGLLGCLGFVGWLGLALLEGRSERSGLTRYIPTGAARRDGRGVPAT